MSESQQIKVVDAFDLDDELRSLLKPGEMLRDHQGRRHRLPRYFYEVPAHDAAVEIRLTPHFGINEFILVDLRGAQKTRAARSAAGRGRLRERQNAITAAKAGALQGSSAVDRRCGAEYWTPMSRALTGGFLPLFAPPPTRSASE